MLATHEVDLADDVLTRALILRDGRLVDDISGRGWRQAYRDGAVARVLSAMFARTVWTVFRKDVTVEVRSRETLATTLFFALSAVIVFAVALVKDGRVVADAAVGILWVAIAFAGTLTLGRTFERERYTDTLRALLLAPVAARGHLRGQAPGGARRCSCWSKLMLVPLVALLFDAALLQRPVLLVALLVTGTIGFASVGTLFAAMLVRARSRDVLLPVLLYPMTIPVIIAGVRGTAALAQPVPDEPMATFWLMLLAVVRHGVRDAGALDVRPADDGLTSSDVLQRSVPLLLVTDDRRLCGRAVPDPQRARTNRRWGWCRRSSTSMRRRAS